MFLDVALHSSYMCVVMWLLVSILNTDGGPCSASQNHNNGKNSWCHLQQHSVIQWESWLMRLCVCVWHFNNKQCCVYRTHIHFAMCNYLDQSWMAKCIQNSKCRILTKEKRWDMKDACMCLLPYHTQPSTLFEWGWQLAPKWWVEGSTLPPYTQSLNLDPLYRSSCCAHCFLPSKNHQ